MSQPQTAKTTKAGTSSKSTQAKGKKPVRKGLSADEIKDLDLDPVDDKETIAELMADVELDDAKDLVDDLEPVRPVKTDKSAEPESKKAEVIKPKVEIKELTKVAKTENQLMDMVALAKLNKVSKIEVSEKLMRHYNRAADELPSHFWFHNVMLVLEGKSEAVEAELTRSLY